MEIGELVRRHRSRLGLSQEDLAARAALSVRAIRDLERGRVATPRAQSVHRLARALQLDGAELEEILATTAASPVVAALDQPTDTAVHARPTRRTEAVDADRPERTERKGRGVHIGILGPLTVRATGADRDVASTLRRSLLGLLALHPHQIVPREEIVDALWGPRPPRTSHSLIHVYVGQLRALLEPERSRRAPARTVVLAGGGYRLEVEPNQVDAATFDALLARAHRARDASDLDRALSTYVAALEQWRGPVLADGAASVRHHPTAIALGQRRVSAALAMADVASRLGRVEESVPWLRGLAHDEVLHEGLHARLMLALATTGQQAAALRVYAELRDRLSDELGIGPGAELQEAHVRVLRQQYGPTTVTDSFRSGPIRPTPLGPMAPAQLPADVPAFTGRSEHLRELASLVDEPAEAVVIAAITGTAGVGKTALAVHFAHRVRERFPDGQLYVNLRGYATGPKVRPIEALAGFLVALGVPPEQVPLDVGNAAGLYRSLLADRSVLVLIDNASHPDDIRPLLPGGAGSVVLVTSRDQLAGLVARDGARRVGLDVLSAGEAHTLLGRLVGPDRVLAELEATAELASLCAGLPLALRIAAANLTGQREYPLARYAAQLRAGNRLAALVVAGDEETAVRAAFDLSYTALPEPARRLFRLLGLVPGPDATPEAAAALAGIAPEEANRLLDRLVEAHLLDQHKPSRYVFHDLLRLYARTQSVEEDARVDRDEATDRLLRFYLHRCHEAAQLLFGHMFRIPLPDDPAPLSEPFDGHAPAMAWYDAERENLLAATASANANGPRRYAWLLVDAIRGYLVWRMYTVDWLAAARVGLAAAEAEGDLIGQLAMLLSLGNLNTQQSRHDKAIEYHTRAFEVAEAAGSLTGQAVAQTNLGGVYVEIGRLGRAAVHLRASLELNRRAGLTSGRINNHANLGSVSLYLGRLADAADEFQRSVTLAAQLKSHTVYAVDLGNLAETYCLLGRYDDAAEALTGALAAHRETGNRASEASALRVSAHIEYERGRLTRAQAIAEQAVALAAESGHRRGEAEALTVLAATHLALGDPRSALEHSDRAMRLARDTSYHYPEVDALVGVCRAERLLGRHADGVEHAERAVAAARQAEFALIEGKALLELAELKRELHDLDAAWKHAKEALDIQQRCGYRVGVAAIHVLMGWLHHDRGEPDAPDEWRQAHLIYTEMGAGAAAQVASILSRYESDGP